jgi:transmembrane sensor
MNPRDPKLSPAGSAIDEAAIAWLIERSEGLTAQREREFAAWLAADERHAAALRRLEKSCAVLEEMPAFREELDAAFRPRGARVAAPVKARTNESREEGSEPRLNGRGDGDAFARSLHARHSRWLALGGIAAALALGGFFWSKHVFGTAEQRYATAADARQTITLNDGSVLELNAATTARVRFTRGERRVDLEAGEAHFAVAHDVTRPFIVAAGNVAVRAVGTAFDVRRSAAAIEVVVVEGKVEVRSTAVVDAAAPVVEAGERAVVERDAPANAARVEKIDAATIRVALSWQPTVIEFADEPLRQVIARFNRRNRVQLILHDPELAACKIGGVFALDEVEAFVRLLERDGILVAERSGENEIVLRRKP